MQLRWSFRLFIIIQAGGVAGSEITGRFSTGATTSGIGTLSSTGSCCACWTSSSAMRGRLGERSTEGERERLRFLSEEEEEKTVSFGKQWGGRQHMGWCSFSESARGVASMTSRGCVAAHPASSSTGGDGVGVSTTVGGVAGVPSCTTVSMLLMAWLSDMLNKTNKKVDRE